MCDGDRGGRIAFVGLIPTTGEKCTEAVFPCVKRSTYVVFVVDPASPVYLLCIYIYLEKVKRVGDKDCQGTTFFLPLGP